MIVHDEKSTTPLATVMKKSRELQRMLYLAAKRCRNRRFHAFYDRVYRLDILWRAWYEDFSYQVWPVVDLECCGKKIVGKPCAGEPHARFDEAGDGNRGDTNGAIS